MISNIIAGGQIPSTDGIFKNVEPDKHLTFSCWRPFLNLDSFFQF